jgi:hypothetical protein
MFGYLVKLEIVGLHSMDFLDGEQINKVIHISPLFIVTVAKGNVGIFLIQCCDMRTAILIENYTVIICDTLVCCGPNIINGMAVFWIVLCSLTEVYRHFRGACCLHHQGDHHNDDSSSRHL